MQLPDLSGIELLKSLKHPPVFIFISSHSEHAAESFNLDVIDYIVKPVTPARFIQAIDRARELTESAKQEVTMNEDEFIFFRDSNIVRRLSVDEILFVEAMGDYVKLYTAQKFYAIHNTLKAVEERLQSPKFIRVHRSYIVAVQKIDTVRDGVLIIGGKTVPVADAYRAALNKRMNIL